MKEVPVLAVDRVFRLARKELREILRDRRTIMTLIAMPLLLYPLMSVAFQQFYLASRATPASGPIYHVKVLTNVEANIFNDRLLRGQRILEPWFAKPRVKGEIRERPKGVPQFTIFLSDEEDHTPEQRRDAIEKIKPELREGKIDLLVLIPDIDRDVDPPDLPIDRDRLFECQIFAMPNSAPGLAALGYVERMFAAANEADLKKRLNIKGEHSPIRMLALKRTFLETTGHEGLVPLAALVPLILILMTITGAVYPAIDLTAGERERGTLEILVAAPVSRFELLTAKYFSVFTVAVLNAIVNLICMSITVTWSGLGATVFGSSGLTIVLLLEIFALLLLFAAFFSAVLLCLTSLARSFKEAQAYLIPLMLASMMPGVLAMIPGLKLDGVLAVIPLVNVVLLTRDLFESGAEPVSAGIVAIVVLTTLLYALAALSLAARVFGAESVLYSEQSSWADLLRRPDEPQPTATIPATLWCLALMVPMQFALLAGLRELSEHISPAVGVVVQILVNVLLFGFLPAIFVYLGRVVPRTGLGLQTPRPGGVLGALLLGVSLWPMQLFLILLFHQGVPSAIQESVGRMVEDWQRARASLGWFVIAIVIVPAILEEIFFRGFLFNAIRTRANAWVTITISGLLFGLTHVILGGALGPDRFVPSTLLGLILSAVCWRTGSVWPSLLQHVCHNVILFVFLQSASGTEPNIRWWWLAVSALGAIVGGVLLWRFGKPLPSAVAISPAPG